MIRATVERHAEVVGLAVPSAFERFAADYGLHLRIVERAPEARLRGGVARWFARFDHSDVKVGRLLHGVVGEGDAFPVAVADYMRRIAGQLLIVTADGERIEIQCPADWGTV